MTRDMRNYYYVSGKVYLSGIKLYEQQALSKVFCLEVGDEPSDSPEFSRHFVRVGALTLLIGRIMDAPAHLKFQ
jgi:hypothetical protein